MEWEYPMQSHTNRCSICISVKTPHIFKFIKNFAGAIWILFFMFFTGVWGYRRVSGPAREWRLHCQLALLQHCCKTTGTAAGLLSHSLVAKGPGFWLCAVLTRAPSAAESVKLASQVTRWEAAKVPGFAPTVNPTRVTPTLSASCRETAALAVW